MSFRFYSTSVRALLASFWLSAVPLMPLTSEFQRWYKPPDLSVESIQNLKSKILKPRNLSVGSIQNLKSKI